MRDQTNDEWKSAAAPSDLGTAVLALAPPLGETSDHYQKAFLPGITYHDCLLFARSAVAFKWVPESVKPPSDLDIKEKCGQSCQETGYCIRPECLCIDGICR